MSIDAKSNPPGKLSRDPRAYGGARETKRRSRQIRIRSADVKTDGVGNIVERPLTKDLPCFGNPIERLMGLYDEMKRYKNHKPQASGCAGCPSIWACESVVFERLESDPELHAAYELWDREKHDFPFKERFNIPSWEALVILIGERSWDDPNDWALVEEKDRRARERRKKRKTSPSASKNASRPKKVPPKLREAIKDYRDERVQEMLTLKQDPHCALWVRNRSEERLILIADAWQARELLDREGRKCSGRAVMERLKADGKLASDAPIGIVKRVEEALNRAGKLIDEDIWPIFDPFNETFPREPGYGMHPDAIWEILDDEGN